MAIDFSAGIDYPQITVGQTSDWKGKMRIRWKFFIVLLAFSLIPLLVVVGISRHNIRRLGETLAADTEHNLSAILSQDLVQTAQVSADVIRSNLNQLHLSLDYLAAKARLAFDPDSPPHQTRIYTPDMFGNPDTAPPDVRLSWRYPVTQPDGRRTPAAISLTHPVFVIPEALRRQRTEIPERLAALTPVFQQIYGPSGDTFVHRVYFGLSDGIHVSFPGHGDFPADFDPRQRPWYHQALQSSSASWTSYSDATTDQIVFTLSQTVRDTQDRLIGVAAIDILPAEFLEMAQLRNQWFVNSRAMIARLQKPPQANRPAVLEIIAREDYEHRRTAHTSSGPRTMPSLQADAALLPAFVTNLQTNMSGISEMPFEGQPSLWAFARIQRPRNQPLFLLLIAPKTIVTTRTDRMGRHVLNMTGRIYWVTGIATLLTLALVVLVGWLGARTITRPLMLLLDAWKLLAQGDFSVRLNAHTGDERDILIAGFNSMIPKLEAHFNLSQNMALAREIQRSLLPGRLPDVPGLDIAGDSRSCDETGGDYYDVFASSANRLAVVVGDVSGHGVAAALLMTSARAMIRSLSQIDGDPAACITRVNRQLCPDTADTGNFITLFFLEIDAPSRTCRWVRAGHDPAIVYDPSQDRFSELDAPGMALGIEPNFVFESRVANLGPDGQIVLIGTDGIWEAHNAAGEMFGKARLRAIIRRHHRGPAAALRDAVFAAVTEFTGPRAEDDVTLAVIKIS